MHVRYLGGLVFFCVSVSALIFPLQPNEKGEYDASFNVIRGYENVWRSNQHAIYNYFGQNAVAIAPRWFLTAWHVTSGADTNYFINDDRIRYYVADKVDLGNDLALVKVDKPVPFYSRIQKFPGGDGDIMTVYGQSAAPTEPARDRDGNVIGWKFGAVTNYPALRWGRARRLPTPATTIRWQFSNNDIELGQGGLNCTALSTNDSGGGIFVGEELVGIIRAFSTTGYRLTPEEPIAADCEGHPTAHIFDASTLYRCSSLEQPFTLAYGSPVYIALSNIYSHISPSRLVNAGGPQITDSDRVWEQHPDCQECSYFSDSEPGEIDRSSVTNPAPAQVYQTTAYLGGRKGAVMTYVYDDLLKHEKYRVRLHFAGIFPATAPGLCAERVRVNSAEQLFDPFTGPRKASCLTFDDIQPDENNRITITLIPENADGYATLSGIEVLIESIVPRAPKDLKWETVASYGKVQGLSAVTFGNRRFVATANKTLIVSEDGGLTWQFGTNTPTAEYHSVAFGRDTFVAVRNQDPFDNNPQILSSRDGKHWSARTIEHLPSAGFNSLTFVGDRFIAGGSQLIAVSTDGESWQTIVNRFDPSLPVSAFGNGRFVTTISPKLFATSLDGLNWTAFTPGLPDPNPECISDPCEKVSFDFSTRISTTNYVCPQWDTFGGVFFNQNAFLTFGHASVNSGIFIPGVSFRCDSPAQGTVQGILRSPDGVNWSFDPSPPFRGMFSTIGGRLAPDLFRVGEHFIYLQSRSASSNLTDWVSLDPSWDMARGIGFGNSNYVVVGAIDSNPTFGRSLDFGPLERVDRAVPPGRLTQVAAHGDKLVVINPQPGIPIPLLFSASGGVSFEAVDLPAGANHLRAILYAQDRFIAVGANGVIIHSPTGEAWSRNASDGVTDELVGIAFGEGRWVAVGTNGTILVSTDGATFTRAPSENLRGHLTGVAYGNGLFVAVGASGIILTATNGSDWTSRTAGTRDLWNVTFGGGRFVAVGDAGFVQVSEDGSNWIEGRAGGPTMYDLAYAQGLFMTLDRPNSLGFLSVDGLTWAPITVPAPTRSVNASDGDLWLTSDLGSIGTVSRARLNLAQITLQPNLDATGHFRLSFAAPSNGVYSIYSTDNLATGRWQFEAQLAREAAQVQELSWIYPRTLERSRFFRVQME